MNNCRHIYIQLFFFIFIIDVNSSQTKMRDLWGCIQIELQPKNFKLVKNKKKQKQKTKREKYGNIYVEHSASKLEVCNRSITTSFPKEQLFFKRIS